MTPAEAAFELAKAIVAAGETVPKESFARAMFQAAMTLPEPRAVQEAIVTHGWLIWNHYPAEFELLNPRETPDRQRVRRHQ